MDRWPLTPDAAVLSNALILAQAALASYGSTLTHQRADVAQVRAEVATFADEDTHTFCLVAHDEANVILAFRGTRRLPNWMTSANLWMLPAFGGKVHQGFAHAWSTVRVGVTEQLDRWHTAGRRLWITGHSLGGALATLAAEDFHGQGRAVQQVMTFGAPRVGDSVFAASYTIPTIRFVNYHDPVPWVPPHLTHVGQEWHFLPDGRLVQRMPRWLQVLEHALTLAFQGNWRETLADQLRQGVENHAMTTYLARLTQAAKS
jgi:hypothetical protein